MDRERRTDCFEEFMQYNMKKCQAWYFVHTRKVALLLHQQFSTSGLNQKNKNDYNQK